MDQLTLANFIEQRVVQDIQNSGIKRTFEPFKHWITTLKSNTVCGSHAWNNLAGLLLGYSQMTGQNYRTAFDYCREQAGFPTDTCDKKA